MYNSQLGTVIRFLRWTAAAPTDEGTDRQLLARFATAGDQEAFALLVKRHGRMVFGVCQRILHDSHDAEDAFQGAFLVLARKAGAAGWHDSVGSWLYAVACRVALKVKAGTARRRQHERQGSEMTPPEPDTDAAWRELREVIDTELRYLPEKYRAPLVLCYLEGKTNEEAAQELGWTKGTVSGRLARARDLLRGRLARHGVAMTGAVLAVTLSEKAAPAAVPTGLLHATLETVTAAPLAGAVSVAAVAAEGVLHAMYLTKLKIAAALVVTLTVLGTGAGFFTYRSLARGPADGVALLAPLPLPEAEKGEKAPRSSEPEVKDGLAITITPEKAVFDSKEPLAFTLTFTNQTKEPLALDDLDWPLNYKFQFYQGKDPKECWVPVSNDKWKRQLPPPTELAAGASCKVKIVLGGTIKYMYRWRPDEPSKGTPAPQEYLPKGKYQVRVTRAFQRAPAEKGELKNLWQGTLTTKPVEFEVADKAAEVTERGLSVTVRPAKQSLLAKEPLQFEITFKNVSDKTFLLYGPEEFSYWGWQFEEAANQAEWRGNLYTNKKLPPPAIVVELAPGKTHVTTARLDGFKFRPTSGDQLLNQLPTGKWRLVLDITLDASPKKAEFKHPFWTGKLTTKPAAFEITDK